MRNNGILRSACIFGLHHQPAGQCVLDRRGQAVQQGHHPLLDCVEVRAPSTVLGLVFLQHAQVPWLCVLEWDEAVLVVQPTRGRDGWLRGSNGIPDSLYPDDTGTNVPPQVEKTAPRTDRVRAGAYCVQPKGLQILDIQMY